jgi:hypothetical protein
MEKLPEDAVVVMCMPTSAPHVDDVTIEQCHFCKQDIWFAASTRNQIRARTDDEYYLVCAECWPKHMPNGVFQMPTDEQIREVAEQHGVDFESAKAQMRALIQATNLKTAAERN